MIILRRIHSDIRKKCNVQETSEGTLNIKREWNTYMCRVIDNTVVITARNETHLER